MSPSNAYLRCLPCIKNIATLQLFCFKMSSPAPLPESVLIASANGPITIYNPYTGEVLARFNGSQCPRNGITIVGDERFAASHISPTTGAGFVNLYYWWSKSCMHSIPLPEIVAPLAATFDGSYLFAGGLSGKIHSLAVPSGELIRSFSAHVKPVSCITINRDGSLILSGSDDGTIAVISTVLLLDSAIDTKSKKCGFKRFKGHEASVTGLIAGMGGSGGIMISSSLDWTCKVWRVVNGSHMLTIKFPGEMWCTVLDPSETELYASGMDGLVYERKLKVEKKKKVAQGRETVVWGETHDGAVVSMAVLNYGKTLLTVSENGEICAWEGESGRMISSFSEKIGDISGVVVVKGGGCFANRWMGIKERGGFDGGDEVSKEVTEVEKMEKALKGVVEDRRRAVGHLESEIEITERLLNLMLNEAKSIAKFDDPNQKH